jgi:hypothetical protein
MPKKPLLIHGDDFSGPPDCSQLLNWRCEVFGQGAEEDIPRPIQGRGRDAVSHRDTAANRARASRSSEIASAVVA